MNRYLQKFIKSKASKRIMSGVTAVVMMFGALPVNDLFERISSINFSFFSASAEGEENPPANYKFKHNENNEIIVENADFAEYSQYCQIYKKYHQNDKITINVLNYSGSDESASNFAGLGSPEYPFAGSLTIASNSNITLNLDAPLFNSVYDTVKIENNGSPLKLSRYYYWGVSVPRTTPLIAVNVVPGEGEKATWNIDIKKPTDDKDNYLSQFGGLIGTMEENASLTMNVTMDKVGDDTNAIALEGSADIGLLCGCMEKNSSLTASFSTDRGTDGHGIGSITTSSGNAGGLVGTMRSGSTLDYTGDQYQAAALDIKTSDGYAGGIVGCNEGGTITTTLPSGTTEYTIAQHIEGTLGQGAVYGYYKPAADTEFDVSGYDITTDCLINGSGHIGGRFGVLENNHDMTVKGAASTELTASYLSGSAGSFGGIIGCYKTDSLDNSLLIKDLTVTPVNTPGTALYGGGIGYIDDASSPAYVKFDNFTVKNATNAGAPTFGGLTAKADRSFVEGYDVTVSVSGNIKGGAAVGSLADGVLKLSGKFDISGAVPIAPEDAYHEGKIVGYRDNALIYADGWTYTGNDAEVDNIGSWGDIIVIDGTKLVKSGFITENSDHTITLAAPSAAISSAADYAKVSLAYQLNTSQNPVITNDSAALADGTTSRTITFGSAASVDLRGTGLRGITRDNYTSDAINPLCTFVGTVNGNGSTIIQDTRNVGNYPVYRHKYNGMFGFAKNSAVSDLNFGSTDANGTMMLTALEKMFGGAYAAQIDGTLNASNIKVYTDITAAGSNEIYVGGLSGWGTSSLSDITVSGSTFSSDITDNNTQVKDNNRSSSFGGVIGRIDQETNNDVVWSFSDDTISGSITSSSGIAAKAGGLIAVIDDSKGTSTRALELTDINVNGLSITGAGTTMGGLLGYSWLNVNTTFHNVTATGTNSISNTNTKSADLAGLVYTGTGHWVVEKAASDPGIKIDGLKATASNAKSFGMIVNQGKSGDNSAIFLEIKNGGYEIASSTDQLKAGCVYDELVAYSATVGKVNENGQGVVSINVGGTGGGLTMDGSASSNTYVAQTTRGQSTPNANTRYYYDLDTIRTKGSLSDPEKLLLWALHRYAHSSISSYFTDSGWGDTIPSASYDMRGYSWYPVDVSGTVTVDGKFTFYNGEFEGSESEKSNTVYTSLGTSNTHTQHHLMQNGLFRDVLPGGNVVLGSVSFSGNVGADEYGSGALVYGTVKGDSASNTASVSMAEGGSVTLDGIYVHSLNVSAADRYALLLIDQIASYSTVVIGNISNSEAYKDNDLIAEMPKDNGYPKAASSLIGKAGNESATNINLSFSGIKLDGRKTAQAGQYDLDSVYNTSCSLFTNATMLQHFQYASGSSGIYNYTYDEDWPAARNVTYGSEISDSSSEYYGQEFWYNEEPHDESGRYTVYKSDLTPTSGDGTNYTLSFSGFLPYVATQAEATQHPLSVNHAVGTLTGCGTYNDPYIIPNGTVFNNITELINGTGDATNFNLPKANNAATLKNTKWDSDGHEEYHWNNSQYEPVDGSGNTYSQEDVRTYLAGAYYKLSGAIDLPESFRGLGNVQAEYAVFRGYIIGDHNIITLNNSAPLIVNSYGSVVKDVTVKLGKDVVLANQTSAATFWYNNTTVAYGMVMSRILGGDNIIDAVSVDLDDHTIKIGGNNNNNKLVPIGGYVGTVLKGSLVFRNMNGSGIVKTGLEESSVLDYDGTAIPIKDNYKWLYINPIIGRVFNAAVFTESNAYRPFEEGTRKYFDKNGVEQTYTWPDGAVTMQNGTKNYSIADIDSSLDQFSVNSIVGKNNNIGQQGWNNGDNTFRRYIDIDIDIPNAQSLYVISLVTQTGISSSNFHARKKSGNRATNQTNNTNYIPGNFVDPIGGWYETDDWGVGPYNSFRTTHIANYDLVGNCGTAPSPEPADTSHDYYEAKTDIPTMQRANARATRTETVPYIVYKYTPKLDTSSGATEYKIKTYGDESGNTDVTGKNLGYIAFNLTHQYSYLHLELTGSEETLYDPDGFRGIGMVGYNNNFMTSGKFDEIYQDMITHIYGFNGNGKTISLNMHLNSYEKNFDSKYSVSSYIAGFGFFDSVMMNKSISSNDIDVESVDYQMHDFTLTGSVSSKVYSYSNGNEVLYPNEVANSGNNYYYPVGGLIGAVSWRTGNNDEFKTSLNSVNPSNLTVEGIRYTGGLIGYNCSNDSEPSLTAIYNFEPEKLTVRSTLYAGGLIGYTKQTGVLIEDVTVGEPDIQITLPFNNGAYGSNAVGGIIGYAETSTNNQIITLRNVTIGDKDTETAFYIGYDKEIVNTTANNELVKAGGFIGQCATNSTTYLTNHTEEKYSTKIENCNVYNVDIYGHQTGGCIGLIDNDNTSFGILGTNVISSDSLAENAMIRGSELNIDRGCGGLIGQAGVGKPNFDIDGCTVEGYVVKAYKYAGGLVGQNYKAGTNNVNRMAVRNSKVDDVTIIAASDLGGIIGFSQKCLYGYNINLNGLSFEGLNGTALSKTDSKCGYIMGSKGKDTYPVRIAGFSRTGTLPDFRMVGNQNDTPLGSPLPYGNDGYVIFADYEGKSLTGSRSTVFSNIYDYTNNVKDYNGLKVGADGARDNAPYVTSSPKVSIGTDQFLTGDGVSSISYDSSAFKKIVDGRSKSPVAAGAYISGPETALTDDELAAIKAIYSNSRAEFEQSTGVTAQFPLLVISDTDYTKITPIINNYLRTLTNTNYNFADNDSNSAVFTTALNTCVFDKSSGTFVLQRPEDKPDNSANLYMQSINGKYYFRMNANSVDNGRQNAQFTLLDVQFRDPADTEKIAYHLYVPVLVKKLLRFEFNASIESGTPYYPEAFATKRTLFENLGNPVTVKFEYSYQRTESEWADAINQGENMLGNLYKSLSATYSGSPGVNDWPADTRLVLVDASNKDKSYYLDDPTNAADLEFSSFTDESGEHYAPVPLNDLMKVTITAKDSGKLVRNNVEVNGVETNTAENATVKGEDGYYYRMATDDELSGSVQKYEAAVTEVKKEVYYLSIFTPKTKGDTNIYHIELKTANKFAETAGQIGWRPNEVKGSNLPVHLLTGKLYETTYELSDVSETGTTTMSSQNKFLKVTMKATVSLTDNAVNAGIPGNMQSAGTSTIYQTFMMTYDTKKAEGEPSVIGLSDSVYPYTTMLSYKIYKGKEIDENKIYKDVLSSVGKYEAVIAETNHIELWNKQNLISEISRAENEYAVTINTIFNVLYEADSLGYQFPKKTSAQQNVDIGAKVIGYSNISSNLNNITYSDSSWQKMGQNRYYTEDSNSAVLTYNANTVPESADNIAGPYSPLGINAFEVGNSTSHIDSTVVYDTSAIKVPGDYVEFTLKLSSRMAHYNDSLVISSYFRNLQIKGANDQVLLRLNDGVLTQTDTTQIKVTSNADETEYRVRVHKSLLPTLGQDGVYSAAVSYDVYTGDDKFKPDGFAYSNYMVTISGALYDKMNSASYITSSNDSDHIIYTNAKLQSQVLD